MKRDGREKEKGAKGERERRGKRGGGIFEFSIGIRRKGKGWEIILFLGRSTKQDYA